METSEQKKTHHFVSRFENELIEAKLQKRIDKMHGKSVSRYHIRLHTIGMKTGKVYDRMSYGHRCIVDGVRLWFDGRYWRKA